MKNKQHYASLTLNKTFFLFLPYMPNGIDTVLRNAPLVRHEINIRQKQTKADGIFSSHCPVIQNLARLTQLSLFLFVVLL